MAGLTLIGTWLLVGRYWETVQRLKINQFYGAPTAFRLLLKYSDSWVKKYDRSSLRTLGSGEPMHESVCAVRARADFLKAVSVLCSHYAAAARRKQMSRLEAPPWSPQLHRVWGSVLSPFLCSFFIMKIPAWEGQARALSLAAAGVSPLLFPALSSVPLCPWLLFTLCLFPGGSCEIKVICTGNFDRCHQVT